MCVRAGPFKLVTHHTRATTHRTRACAHAPSQPMSCVIILQTKIVKKTKNRVKILKYFVRNPIIGKVLRISEPNVTVNVVISFVLLNV